MNPQLKAKMNQILANLNVMYMKLHHYHWFVKGPHFFVLHEKFEELYNEVTSHTDDIAERLLTLEQKPISTLKQCLELATVKEADSAGDDTEMVQAVLDDFAIIVKQLYDGIEMAEEDGDEGTVDLLLGVIKSFEKHIWMLRAFNS